MKHHVITMVTTWNYENKWSTNTWGTLKPEYRQYWADYISHYVIEYSNKGFAVDMLTIQNEPNATQTWDSCLYTAEEEKEFLRDYLYPSLVKNGSSDLYY